LSCIRKYSWATVKLVSPRKIDRAHASIQVTDFHERHGRKWTPNERLPIDHVRRSTPNVSRPSSAIIRLGRFVSAPETSASPHTLKVMEHLKKKFVLAPTVPRSFFNPQNGISFLDSNRNRYESSQCLACYAALSPVNLIFATMHILQLTIYLPTSQHGFKCELQRTVGRAAASSVVGIDQEKGNRETILVKSTVIVTIRHGLQTSDAGISLTDEIKTVHFPEVAHEKRGTKLECSICGHGRITFPKLRTHFPGCVGDKGDSDALRWDNTSTFTFSSRVRNVRWTKMEFSPVSLASMIHLFGQSPPTQNS